MLSFCNGIASRESAHPAYPALPLSRFASPREFWPMLRTVSNSRFTRVRNSELGLRRSERQSTSEQMYQGIMMAPPFTAMDWPVM